MNTVTLNIPLVIPAALSGAPVSLGTVVYWTLAVAGEFPTAHRVIHGADGTGTVVLCLEEPLGAAELSRIAKELGVATVAQHDHITGQSIARAAKGTAPWPAIFYTIVGEHLV